MFGRPKLNELTPAEVRDLMAQGKCVLVDVREPEEFAQQRIEGAVNLPLSRFDPAAIPEANGRKVVLQCGSGKRSAMAAQRCQAAGVNVDSHLTGGIGAWMAAGHPVKR